MRIVLIGANGTIGSHVKRLLESDGHEVIGVGRASGDYQVNIEDPQSISALYKKVGKFDAVANASGSVAFAPLTDLKADQWMSSLRSKLMGQIHLVLEAIPYINENGSFTLISGILSEEFIRSGVAATTVNCAVEGFVRASAFELPKGLRINAVSPTLLEDSVKDYGPFFPGFVPVAGDKVALAYKRSILGIQSGMIFRVIQ